MAYMRRTLNVIHFASQLCGISQYIWFLRNGGYEKPVTSRKYLFYSFILFIGISVIEMRLAIAVLIKSTSANSDAQRVHYQVVFSMLLCILTTYMVSAVTRLIGQCNFFKICRKLLSVSSLLNYQESANISNTVIAIHVVLFFSYLIRYSFEWISNNCVLQILCFFISGLICETVTRFAAVQLLYFVLTLRRHFMLLNSKLNESVVSTVKSKNIHSFKVRTIADFFPENCSTISGLREILRHHAMLCDIMALINSSYSLQVLAFIGSKFVFATISLYLLFFSVYDPSAFPIHSFFALVPLVSVEVLQLATVVCCCNCASFQVGTI
jgi:hypothetical protein